MFILFIAAAIIDSWAGMSSPIAMLTVLAFYLAFVYNVGPSLMRHRQAFKLDNAIRVYNIFQIIACSCLVVKFLQAGFNFRSAWSCSHSFTKMETIKFSGILWYAMFLRWIELLETVFFTLRKKQNQISFLHVFHHVGTMVWVWLVVKYDMGSK